MTRSYLDLPWPDVLDGELKEHGLAWSYSDSTVMIAPPPNLRRVWGTDLLLFSTLSADAGGLLATTRALLSDAWPRWTSERDAQA